MSRALSTSLTLGLRFVEKDIGRNADWLELQQRLMMMAQGPSTDGGVIIRYFFKKYSEKREPVEGSSNIQSNWGFYWWIYRQRLI